MIVPRAAQPRPKASARSEEATGATASPVMLRGAAKAGMSALSALAASRARLGQAKARPISGEA